MPPSTGVRHTTGTVLAAKQLYEAGWPPPSIARILQERGVDPAPHVRTIRLWVVPGEADRRAARRRDSRQRLQAATAVVGQGRYQSARLRLERLRRLRDAGMSYSALAIIAHVDFALEVTDENVRYLLNTSPKPSTIAKYLAPEQAVA